MKKIIFFLVYLTVNSYSDSNYDIDSACCSQYGQRTNGSSGIIEKVTLYSGNVTGSSANGSTIYDVADTFRLTYDDDRTCLSAGLVSLNDVQTEFTDPDGTWVHLGDGVYTRSDAHVYTRKILYICECDKVSNPDIPKTDPDPTWYLVGSVNCLGDSSGDTTDLMITSRTDCCDQTDYYKVKETCLDGGIWSELSDGSWGCVAPPCEGDECNDGGDNPYGRCTEPKVELNAISQSTCMQQPATELEWHIVGEDGYCCGLLPAPVCPATYTRIDNEDGSTPTSEQCESMAIDLGSTYNNVDSSFLTNTSGAVCCMKWDSPASDDNETDDGSGDDSNETIPPDDGSGDSTDDSNETTPPGEESTDTNSTDLDLTETNEILNGIKSEIETQGQGIQSKQDETNTILGDIKTDIASASTKNHEDLGSIKDSIVGSSAQNHTDLEGISGKLDSLEDIKDNTKNTADYMSSLKELGEESAETMISVKDGLNDSLQYSMDSTTTLVSDFSQLSSYLTGNLPVFTATGDCILSYVIWGRNVVIDLNFIESMRFYLDIFFAMLLAYINVKMYLKIFAFLAFMGI